VLRGPQRCPTGGAGVCAGATQGGRDAGARHGHCQRHRRRRGRSRGAVQREPGRPAGRKGACAAGGGLAAVGLHAACGSRGARGRASFSPPSPLCAIFPPSLSIHTHAHLPLYHLLQDFEIDFVSLSTTRSSADVRATRALLARLGLQDVKVIAKVGSTYCSVLPACQGYCLSGVLPVGDGSSCRCGACFPADAPARLALCIRANGRRANSCVLSMWLAKGTCILFHAGTASAQVETAEGVAQFDRIAHAADAVLLGRGNLAVDVDAEHMAGLQKRCVTRCNMLGKPVILTRFVDTMVSAWRPHAGLWAEAGGALGKTAAAAVCSQPASSTPTAGSRCRPATPLRPPAHRSHALRCRSTRRARRAPRRPTWPMLCWTASTASCWAPRPCGACTHWRRCGWWRASAARPR
jgi:hypothetical protein